MPGTEPDEEICEMVMRTSSQEALSGLKKGLLSLFSDCLSGSEITDRSALVRAEIDSKVFDTFAQRCKDIGVDLNVVDMNIEKSLTVFEFKAERLDDVRRITDEMIKDKLLDEPLKLSTIEESRDDLEKLTTLLKDQGIDLSAKTDELGCVEFTIKAKSWDEMAKGFGAAAVANGELAPSYASLPVSEELLGALKATPSEEANAPFRVNVGRTDRGDASLVINTNELQAVEDRLGKIAAPSSGVSDSLCEEAQRTQQQLLSIKRNLDEAKAHTLDKTISMARSANLAEEKAGNFVKDRNRQAELVR